MWPITPPPHPFEEQNENQNFDGKLLFVLLFCFNLFGRFLMKFSKILALEGLLEAPGRLPRAPGIPASSLLRLGSARQLGSCWLYMDVMFDCKTVDGTRKIKRWHCGANRFEAPIG